MNNKKRILLGISVVMAASLALTACGGKKGTEGKNEETAKVDAVEEDVELTEKEKETKTLSNSLEEAVALIGDMKDVELVDIKPQTDINDPERLYILDLKLNINVEDKEEAEKLMEEYSNKFFEEMYKLEKYEEVTILWTSPNHPEADAVEIIDYKG